MFEALIHSYKLQRISTSLKLYCQRHECFESPANCHSLPGCRTGCALSVLKQLAAPEVYSAWLGSHYHGCVVCLREWIHQLYLKVPQYDRQDSFDLQVGKVSAHATMPAATKANERERLLHDTHIQSAPWQTCSCGCNEGMHKAICVDAKLRHYASKMMQIDCQMTLTYALWCGADAML